MRLQLLSLIALCGTLISAHTVVQYPGYRGNNLITNDDFPYGMQWQFPCGGLEITQNRTKWPLHGGAIAIQPGWFQGHATAFFYINLGWGTDGPRGGPQNWTFVMVPTFQITGPSKGPYPGTFCLPQVPLPANTSFNVGDNATIQIVETALHGAALYNCIDITFADPKDVPEVNASNCFNSSDIGFNNVYTSTVSAASLSMSMSSFAIVAAAVMWGVWFA